MIAVCKTCDLPFWDGTDGGCGAECNGCDICRAFCYGSPNNCAGQAVDWRTRCLTAEAKLAAAEAVVKDVTRIAERAHAQGDATANADAILRILGAVDVLDEGK